MDMIELGTHPIPGDAPGGADVKYEPEYGIVLGEIEKLGSAVQGGGVSWPLVVDTCAQILREQSKDFLIAAYMAAGLCETRGVAGLTDGVVLLADFLEYWWEDGFPPLKRARARVNALEWWRERAMARLQGLEMAPLMPANTVRELRVALERLDGLIGDRMPDVMPLRDMQQAVQRLPVEQEQEPVLSGMSPAPGGSDVQAMSAQSGQSAQTGASAESALSRASAPSASVPAPSSSAASGVSSGVTRPASVVPPPPASDAPPPQEVSGWRALFCTTARDFAFAGHAALPEDPLPWQALRQGVWGKLAQLPPAEGGVTLIPAPDPLPLEGLRSLIASGRALEAALGAENMLPECPFWLDVQHVAATALGALGPEFAEALTAVCEETARLLRRMPGIEQYCFADATPFAREDTQQWLASLAAGVGSKAHPGGDPVVDEALLAADAAYAGGDTGRALRLLEAAQGADGASGRRGMRLRVAQLRFLLRAGMYEPALAVADTLFEDSVACGLERWEPQFFVDVLRAVLDAYTDVLRDAAGGSTDADSTSGTPSEFAGTRVGGALELQAIRTRRQDVVRRIARISPSVLTR